ncbi:MAG: hybrid sensor histidine kinase/response regulator [Rhodoferax sp.]|nr:hybrid sensor histidine kinase/response regulator [Rhodoferax sp.]
MSDPNMYTPTSGFGLLGPNAAIAIDATTVLYVDDEPQACKWFKRMFADEFRIVTAGGVDEALQALQQPNQIAVLLTDYRMPLRNGMELLAAAQRDHRHLVRLLVTAFAEKELAIAAINEGHVFRILEKPLDEQRTREALRDALALYQLRVVERAVHEQRVSAMRETLGFLAHELNTPLATVRGYMDALKSRHRPWPVAAVGSAVETGIVRFAEGSPGEVMAAIESAERRALYCQSLVATFVQSARDAYPGATPQSIQASQLVEALIDEYPFENHELGWVDYHLTSDFRLPGRRDLLYLVLCTLTKNALQALRGRPQPVLRIEVGQEAPAKGAGRHWIRLADNGPGIAPEILDRLTLEPVSTKTRVNARGLSEGEGGNGMGLMFCRRVVQSIGGAIEIVSPEGQGATVTLYFQSSNVVNRGGNRA